MQGRMLGYLVALAIVVFAARWLVTRAILGAAHWDKEVVRHDPPCANPDCVCRHKEVKEVGGEI